VLYDGFFGKGERQQCHENERRYNVAAFGEHVLIYQFVAEFGVPPFYYLACADKNNFAQQPRYGKRNACYDSYINSFFYFVVLSQSYGIEKAVNVGEQPRGHFVGGNDIGKHNERG